MNFFAGNRRLRGVLELDDVAEGRDDRGRSREIASARSYMSSTCEPFLESRFVPDRPLSLLGTSDAEHPFFICTGAVFSPTLAFATSPSDGE